ncbi:MAG: 3-isopropylmalate dehydratase small subunit [Gammaproteobacteria bacterium]
MEPFVRLAGLAAPMPLDNVDTDAIIPSRETRSVARDGYGEKLFANWRYTPGTRIENPDFVLNRPPWRQARILVARSNFGCGSSREAAVWSLLQFGIRCVIAPSFGAIFRNNCIRNGLLPVTLGPDVVETLLTQAQAGAMLEVDLEACAVTGADGRRYPFHIGALEREMLLEGLDEIALTLKRSTAIDAFRARDRIARPWIHLPPR